MIKKLEKIINKLLIKKLFLVFFLYLFFIRFLICFSYSYRFSESSLFFCGFLDSTFFGQLKNAVMISQFRLFVALLFTAMFVQLAHNVWQLKEVGDFGAINCLLPQNSIRSTKLHLTTEPPIFFRCCYMPYFFFVFTYLFANLDFNSHICKYN